MDSRLAEDKAASHPNARAIAFDIKNEEERRKLIRDHSLVISMLPAFMHGDVARDCVEAGVHLATASYVSAEIRALNDEAVSKNILLLNECGLDPGIDHASAMHILDRLKEQGAELLAFKSYCGGLVAPESNTNPWGYKFSWNPRNVILAGQGTAQYLEQGELKLLPYNRLFKQSEVVHIKGLGDFDAYANRDSISYIEAYGLQGIPTMLRGTLRQKGYCKAWNVLVRLGLTDDSTRLSHCNRYTYTDLLASLLPGSGGEIKSRLKQFMAGDWDPEIESMLESLDLFAHRKIELKEATPAQLLQHLLEDKWKLQALDKDMVVLQHQFSYRLPSEKAARLLRSSLVVIGKDQKQTAMALTVGLPLAITVKNLLCGKLKLSGIQIPTHKAIYEPLLKELEQEGLVFTEE